MTANVKPTRLARAVGAVDADGPMPWPMRWQQLSGVLSPAHALWVFAQQAIAPKEKRNAIASLDAAANVSSTKSVLRRFPRRRLTSRLYTPWLNSRDSQNSSVEDNEAGR